VQAYRGSATARPSAASLQRGRSLEARPGGAARAESAIQTAQTGAAAAKNQGGLAATRIDQRAAVPVASAVVALTSTGYQQMASGLRRPGARFLRAASVEQ